MKIEGLNQEQLDYILASWGEKLETEEEFLEYLRDSWDIEMDRDSHRHWDEFTAIVQIGERYFGYHAATTTGDMTASEKGFVPDNWVKEFERVEVKSFTFIEKQ